MGYINSNANINILGEKFSTYLSKKIFSFTKHILTTIFCLTTLVIYPLAIFKNKFVKYGGIIINGILIIVLTFLCITNPPVYSADVLASGEEYLFNDSYKVYLIDKKYRDLSVKYETGIEDWTIHAEFKKA